MTTGGEPKLTGNQRVAVTDASYQEIFDAIAAATKIEGGAISISVKDFRAALATPAKEPGK